MFVISQLLIPLYINVQNYILYLSERFWKFSQLSLILRCNSYWVSDLSLGTLLNFLSGPKKEFIYVLLMIF